MFYWKVSKKIRKKSKKKQEEILAELLKNKEEFVGQISPMCCDTGGRNAMKKVAQGFSNARRWLVSKLGPKDLLKKDQKVIINKCKVWGEEYQPVDTDYLLTALSSPDSPEPPKDQEE